MANHSAQTGHDEALAMLDAFASTGATHFDVTWTKADHQPLRYDEAVGLADLARTLPAILDHAARQTRNVIVRPLGPGVTFTQLDDIKGEPLALFAPPRVSHPRNLAGEFSGVARAGRRRGQGIYDIM